jgi:hypothetical protein
MGFNSAFKVLTYSTLGEKRRQVYVFFAFEYSAALID